MAECYTFPTREIRGAKRRAAQAARINRAIEAARINRAIEAEQIDRAVEALADTLAPTPVLESFGCLRMRLGWKLLAYLVDGRLGGESRVFAVPTDFEPVGAELAPAAGPASDADRPYSGSNLDCAVGLPLQARRRFMSAVEGDGSPWSYLCASLAVRQLLDYAAYWHAFYEHDWFEHLILAKWPPPGSALAEPAGDFEGEPPGLWRPAVWVGRRSTTVRLYTYRPATANPEGIWMHEDRYEAGSYDPELTRTLIAAGRSAIFMY